MSRSGYSDDCENINLYRGTVERSICGKRGQIFLKGLARALDEIPAKRLISGKLITDTGEVCTIGAYCKTQNILTKETDPHDSKAVGSLVNISWQMAAEIEFLNDDDFGIYSETPEQRWIRMREWVDENITQRK